ncbi:Phosphoribosylcarboxyaminoimidazole (NCAIR) mutase (PurE) (PDB:1D7A) [Commensalibacter communis]|uniref:N5-carboxyaminoimidazole ribonucleotide mutase n=1 Tax=Commensalibacter communis TaxID=2972786 RepID=A0A9W4XI60_9PROT|nr:5-(carboxyamino)imidazole ribonucleotide mutase [Commensalibacter communis]CAI3924435.1 Phosphoribosylcarboxyaminoimidazole (NCAIR) mutase (PurE) (PDB:1D7A) [Commensalibacter communis]CAI3924961.1 Phosphoribosylcarboxyaminoimidazole (NCAIR) mutase (PurE) (PDB:1D7A) [Commensalibacter communis]CAI3937100.1 Phosphoribosylcarboxyaminoimidazole (NCAIR) mutase (PurE) (PDB:1D7A) [Commensalibacter communis]CAI3945703.1 Phosphoribosylcarboxyaminoimidazole (NCAIR) mutase (PurE) (PDB:1D7A) [Commensalib
MSISEQNAPLIGIIMGSQSDWDVMSNAVTFLRELNIPHEVNIVSAHRTPDRLREYSISAASKGIKVIIAGAGGAAHLPGMTAAWTHLPVLGVPMQTHALSGKDSLLSIVQMPAGIPVGTLAIGKAGAINAAIMATSILALSNSDIEQRLIEWRTKQTESVALTPV